MAALPRLYYFNFGGQDMLDNSKWKFVLNRYVEIKELYIECEETDPELKTNLQPLNEFRAALDHTFRVIGAELRQDDEKAESEIEKLSSHLRRAFFDICDMLAVNYRNKIISSLEPFSSDAIKDAIPQYYSEYRPAIEKISANIGKYRNDKGNLDVEEEVIQSYKNDVMALKELFIEISYKIPSVKEINRDQKRKIHRGYIIGLAGAIVGIISILIALLK